MEKIKIGVFGAGRGVAIAQNFQKLGAEIVALCDNHKGRIKDGLRRLNRTEDQVKLFDNFDDFISYPMDAVVVANNFYEHTPYAIKCLEKNLHVFCECITNATMGEGVELINAFEKSNSVFMLAENYPQMLFNREMKRIVDGGTLGKIVYAEGEYNHPANPNSVDFIMAYKFYREHWRHYIPRTYYVTHSLGPIMHITGATPKKVTAFAMFAPIQGDVPTASFNGDNSANITTLNDDGSVFRFTGCAGFGAHHNAYRVCGTKGQIENLRGMGEQVMLRYNGWQIPEGKEEINLYTPSWNDKDEELIKSSGHGGGDYLTCRIFLDSIKNGVQPPHPYDIYSATTMSSVAILAHRSVLEGGKVYDIPDFRKEEDKKLYENDYLTPFYGKNGEKPTLPCCSHPDFKPTDKQLELYDEIVKNLKWE